MKNTLITVLLIVSLIGAVTVLLVTEKGNQYKAESRLARAKVDSIAKSKESLQSDFNLLQQKSNEVTQQLEKSQKSDEHSRAQLTASRTEIAKKSQALMETNKKCEESLAKQKKLDSQIDDLKKASNLLQAENKSIQAKLVSLQESNMQLMSELADTKLISKDNILIESLASNGKPYSKGKRVKRIITEFSIKKDLQNPTFRIIGPEGGELPDSNGKFSLERIAEGGTASLKPKKIRLTYAASRKMTKGLYQIEILNDNKHMGNLMVVFR
jgi:hypothetical protein